MKRQMVAVFYALTSTRVDTIFLKARHCMDQLVERIQRWFRTRPAALLRNPFVLKAIHSYASKAAWWYRREFDEVDTYCMFLGYPRSGHSLIGGLLDAHPHMVIAYELNALKYTRADFSERALYYLLLRRSRAFARRGAKSAGYSYYVPGQHNGTFEAPLRVIGDKKGGASSGILSRDPKALDHMRSVVSSPVKIIHMMRHPLDNISTISRKHGLTPMQAANYYFELCRTVQQAKEETEAEDWFEMCLESFVEDPATHLRQLCAFLGQDASSDYIESCAGIVFDSPSTSRDKIEWPEDVLERVKTGILAVDSLRKYD